MFIKNFASCEVRCVSQDDTLISAARLMKETSIGAVVVVKNVANDPTPIGLLTDHDIVIELLANEVDFKAVIVKDLLTKALVTISEDYSLQQAVQTMKTHSIRRLPIIDSQGHLSGMLALDDILVLLAEELNDLASVIKKQMA